jgi:HK97 family phage major capsid protein
MFGNARERELRGALDELDALTRRATLTPQENNRQSYLLSKISVLKSQAPDRGGRRALRSTQGATLEDRAFIQYLLHGQIDEETRDMLAGTQGNLTWTQGPGGGYLVPQGYLEEVYEGMAQFDPLLDPDVVDLITDVGRNPHVSENSGIPTRIVGWDLSTISATRQNPEGGQGTVPSLAVTDATLNGYLYIQVIPASFQFDMDAVPRSMKLLQEAFTIAFARGIGKDLVLGSGSNQPQGVLTGAANSGVTTAAAGALSLADFTSIYFSVNRDYRKSPKCAWLMSDTVYEYARNAKDSQNRPLIDIVGDEERIMGKRVLISPSIPSTAGSQGICFGDLSRLVVRVSHMMVRRATETSSGIERLTADYCAYMRADSAVMDPTAGATPPIVFATLHA